MIHPASTAIAFIIAAALPVSAQSPVQKPVLAEILTGWQQADGTLIAALKLTLAPGWKTYWRSPGDAGIPPQFDWSGSTNIKDVSVTWPAPQVYDQNGMRSIVYSDVVILPLTITPQTVGTAVSLSAELDIGVCRDICMPELLRLNATLHSDDTAPTPAIAAALASRPYSAAEAGVTSAICVTQPTEKGVQLETRLTMPPSGGEEVVVIEAGQPNIWSSETTTTRTGKELVAVGDLVSMDGSALAIDRSAIRITVLGKNHAVDVIGCTAG
ncbi:Disulphide bond corrector protein DsbC [Sulfitobacter brevis]|uniref:Disulphide bond corrector protein DsbC n=1 Tax=Sulfitobacter brevis TaxID=74348 RepID=A0A1I1TC52_9RHOB|nr:protein-disulfide reductase DsbD domain-containing protein [Sulfitobacter brevis]SFD56191.1 Disulphide bond corrector protein DsbC [Sulfitobacter brevis]